jgi:hypothetical protein
MKYWVLLLTIGSVGIIACNKSQTNSEAQQALDAITSQRFEVLSVQPEQLDAPKNGAAYPIYISDRQDSELQFSLNWDPKLPQGGITKVQVNLALKDAEENLKRARALVTALHHSSFPNVAVGVNHGRYFVLAYENPFTTIFSTRMKQFAAGASTWATKIGGEDLPLDLRFVDPQTQNQQSFKTIIPIQLLETANTAFFSNTFLEATANAAYPQSLEEMAGTVNLTGALAAACRKKAHDEATVFASAQAQHAVALELETMVAVDLNMRNMDRIIYRFPYCKTNDAKFKTSCQGHFDGWVSCSYNLKTGTVEEFTNEGPSSFK